MPSDVVDSLDEPFHCRVRKRIVIVANRRAMEATSAGSYWKMHSARF